MGYTLSEFRLDDISAATCKFATLILPSEPGFPALVVTFAGNADNNPEHFGTFRFIRAMTAAALEACPEDPLGMVLDLRLLDYVWGDDMADVLITGKRWYGDDFPTAVVVSERNEVGLTSLLAQEMGADPRQWLFQTFESAVEEIDRQVKCRTSRST